METKAIEIRDRHTFIPAIGILMRAATPAQSYLLGRAGFTPGGDLVVLVRMADLAAEYSPHAWRNGRTMEIAHRWITEHWLELEDGAVVDVEYLSGETAAPAVPERAEYRGARDAAEI